MLITETLLGVIIGGLFTLSGSLLVGLIHYFRTKTEVQAEDRRIKAEMYLDKKADALTTLHAELEECQRGLMEILDRVPSENYGKEGEVEEAKKLIKEYEIAMDRASIYLSEGNYNKLLNLFNVLNDVHSSVDGWMFEPREQRVDDLLTKRRKNLVNEYYAVKEVLQNEIRDPIDEIDR